MITRLSPNSNNHLQQNKKTSFKSGLGLLTQGLQLCEKYPMINVSAIDATTAIIPRTVFDGHTNAFARAETFRRESSGLAVHCLIPSFIVYGVAKAAEAFSGNKFKNTNMSNVWATEDTIKTLSNIYKTAQGATKEEKIADYLQKTIKGLRGADGNTWTSFSDAKFDFKEPIKTLQQAILGNGNHKETKKLIQQAYKSIAEQVGATEALKMGKESIGENLSGFLRDTVSLGKRFATDAVSADLNSFQKWSKKLINTKSLLGLAIVIPLAMSMQPINRFITRITSGKKGAPIYKDFESADTHSQMKEKNNKGLLKEKIVAAGTMMGIAALSMMKKPSLKMLQFNGWFPSVDQCRWISASAFASRMFAAEDKNELKEATVRDISTYLSLYFLGDYAAKGTATIIEKVTKNSKEPIKLLNRLVNEPNAPVYKKVWNWFKNTNVKAFDEIKGAKAKNMRSLCQIANLGASMILLGILIPWYTRHNTEKSRKKKLAEMQQKGTIPANLRLFSGQYYRSFSSFKSLKDITKTAKN